MSNSGKFTPLQLNLLGELNNSRAFSINPVARGNQGVWTPAGYTPGAVVESTVLKDIQKVVRSVYLAVKNNTYTPPVAGTSDPDTGTTTAGTPGSNSLTCLTTAEYDALLALGASIPALANSKPSTFIGTYAGYGSWKGGKNVIKNYPPKKYPVDSSYSYIYSAYGKYAYITGWPGKNSWQKGDEYTGDTYLAAITGDSSYNEYMSTGFISTVARQAYYEMWSGQENQYNAIIKALGAGNGFKTQQNVTIGSYVNSKSFNSGTFSNINDLTTSNLAGVNQAFATWGSDLIATGRAIDLTNIDKFGTPSVLLRTLKQNMALNEAVSMAMLLEGLTHADLESLYSGQLGTPEQERKLYNAFKNISGNDLSSKTNGVLYGINCKTQGLTTLADLLDPMKLFPNSYASLTIPEYNTERSLTASSKVYKFIYSGAGVATDIANWGHEYLDGILPDHLVVAAGAFAMTMGQVKHIRSMKIEKFSQVVANMELPGKNLFKVGTTNGTPTNDAVIDSMLDQFALGSGSDGTYRQCDFQGAMAGYPYNTYYAQVIPLIKRLTTTRLTTAYAKLASFISNETKMNPAEDPASTLPNPPTLDQLVAASIAEFNGLIAEADAAITEIYTNNKTIASQLNYYWDKIGSQMTIEQRATAMAMPDPRSLAEQYNAMDTTNFVKQQDAYAKDTGDGQMAKILELISDAHAVVNGLVSPSESTTPTSKATEGNSYTATTVLGPSDGTSTMGPIISITNTDSTFKIVYDTVGYTPFHVGQSITVSNLESKFNGTYTVSAVDSTSVTYKTNTPITGVPGTPSNGKVTASETRSSITGDSRDTSSLGGQSQLAVMAEARNAARLGLTGGELDNDVDSYVETCGASAKVTLDANGTITGVAVTSGSTGYLPGNLPNILVLPVGLGANLTPVLAADGSISSITINDGGANYPATTHLIIDLPPQCVQPNDPPANYADSQYTQLVKTNLVAPAGSSSTVTEAIADVTVGNCDCWL